MSDDFSDLFAEGPTLMDEMKVEAFAEKAAKRKVRADAETTVDVLNDIIKFYTSHYLEEYTRVAFLSAEYRDYGVVRFTTLGFPSDVVVALITAEAPLWEEKLGDKVVLDPYEGEDNTFVMRVHVMNNLAYSMCQVFNHAEMPMPEVSALLVRGQDPHGRPILAVRSSTLLYK